MHKYILVTSITLLLAGAVYAQAPEKPAAPHSASAASSASAVQYQARHGHRRIIPGTGESAPTLVSPATENRAKATNASK